MSKKLVELKEFFNNCTVTNNILSTPTLYTTSKTNKTRIWTGHVLIADLPEEIEKDWHILLEKKPLIFSAKEPAIYYSSYQQENGKLTISAPTAILVGKNIGRKDETTAFQQALLEIRSEFNKKLKSGAVTELNTLQMEITFENILETNPRVNVMALHDVQKNWDRVVYPACVQPKLDGIHIVTVFIPGKGLDIYSRGLSKKVTQYHIKNAVEPVLKNYPGLYLTGELYKHGMKRQDIVSQASQEKDENIKTRLELHVFDLFQIPLENTPFVELKFYERFNLAQKIVKEINSEFVKIVKTKKVRTREEIEEFYEECIKNNYEGIIIRNAYSFYEYGITSTIRSYNAMKYKKRQDSEFIIVGFKGGEGKFKNCIIFQAKCLDSEITFWASPSWTLEERKKAFLIGETFIGKMATISYDGLSNEGVPQQPVLIAFN